MLVGRAVLSAPDRGVKFLRTGSSGRGAVRTPRPTAKVYAPDAEMEHAGAEVERWAPLEPSAAGFTE